MASFLNTDSEAGYWKPLRKHSEAGYGSLFSGHKRVTNYVSRKSISRYRYSEAAYSKITRFIQELSQ